MSGDIVCMMDAKKYLKESLHISKTEARIYLAALEQSHSSVSRLAKATNISRTALYSPLKKLLERGLLNELVIGKRKYYQATPPQHLPVLIEREMSLLKLAVSELSQTINVPEDEMQVRHFKGSSGFLAAIGILFSEAEKGSILRTVEHPELTLEKWPGELIDKYIEQRVKKQIRTQIINPRTKSIPWIEEKMRNKEKILMDVIVVSSEEYPLRAGFMVNGKNLLIMNYTSIPSATLISNFNIASTFESLHKIIWDRYRS